MNVAFGKIILVAEDNDFMRRIIATALTRMGARVIECANGQEALAVLSTPAEVDLALLDVRMPELHGLHVLQQIRGGRTAQDYTLPVALVTAAHDEATVHYAAALACDGFLLKPVTQAKLVEKLASMMTRRRELPHRPSHYCQIDMGPPDRLPSAPGPIPTGLTVGQLHVGMVFTAPVRGLGREVIPEGVSLTAELLQLLQELEKVMTIEPIQIAKFPD